MLENLKKERSHYHTCKVALLLPTLEKKDQDILLKHLSERAWGSNSLHNALNRAGVFLPAKSIEKHRSEACSCFRN